MDVMVLANLTFEDLILLVKLGELQHKDRAVRKPEILHLARTVGQTLAQIANSAHPATSKQSMVNPSLSRPKWDSISQF